MVFLLNSNIDAKNASLVNLIVNLTFTVKKIRSLSNNKNLLKKRLIKVLENEKTQLKPPIKVIKM